MQRRLLLPVMMLIIQIIAATVSSHQGDNIFQVKRRRRAVFDIIPYRPNIQDLSLKENTAENQWNLFKFSESTIEKQCLVKKKCISRLKKSFELWKIDSKVSGKELRSRSHHCCICLWKLIICLCFQSYYLIRL